MKAHLIEPALEEGSYCWLIDLGGRRVGVNDQSGWCIRIDERVVALDEESKFMPLGPLLELNEAEFSLLLQRAALSMPTWAQRIATFPKETLLKHVFHTSYSSYWPERALGWLAADERLWPKFKEELRAFSINKVMSQAARQQAQQMLRTIGRH